jgi:hypothetical protein
MKVILIFIINGEDVPVEMSMEDILARARNKALGDSHNTGQPPDEWEIRNEKGHFLDSQSTIGSHALKNGSKLFLTLKVGLGGFLSN